MKRGRWNRKKERTSCPCRAFDRRRPPWASTTPLQMARPGSARPASLSVHRTADERSGRSLVSLGAAATAFALRVLLAPLTGTGAPFVLFFRSGTRHESIRRHWTGPGRARDRFADCRVHVRVRAGYRVHAAVAPRLTSMKRVRRLQLQVIDANPGGDLTSSRNRFNDFPPQNASRCDAAMPRDSATSTLNRSDQRSCG